MVTVFVVEKSQCENNVDLQKSDDNVRFPKLFTLFLAVLPFEDQHEILRHERKMEVQINQQVFLWGSDEAYIGLPGYTKAKVHADLPRRVEFTDVANKTLKAGRKSGLINLGLTRWAHKMQICEEKGNHHLYNCHWKN